MALRARIAERRAEAVERRAIAEAALPLVDGWMISPRPSNANAEAEYETSREFYRNFNAATVIRDQDRIIEGCDADLALLDRLPRGLVTGGTYSSSVAMLEAITANLNARYSDADS